MAAAISGLMAPNAPLACAVAFLTMTMLRTNCGTSEIFCVEILKFSMARKVWMPQYTSAGISRSPNKSCSIRTVISLTFSYSCVGVHYAFGTLAQFGKIVQLIRLNRQDESALLRVL